MSFSFEDAVLIAAPHIPTPVYMPFTLKDGKRFIKLEANNRLFERILGGRILGMGRRLPTIHRAIAQNRDARDKIFWGEG